MNKYVNFLANQYFKLSQASSPLGWFSESEEENIKRDGGKYYTPLLSARGNLIIDWNSDEPYARIARVVGESTKSVKDKLKSDILKTIENIPVLFKKETDSDFPESIKGSLGATKDDDYIVINLSKCPENVYPTLLHELRHAVLYVINDTYPAYIQKIKPILSTNFFGKKTSSDFFANNDPSYLTDPNEQFSRIREIRNAFGLDNYQQVTPDLLGRIARSFSDSFYYNPQNHVGYFPDGKFYIVSSEKNRNGTVSYFIADDFNHNVIVSYSSPPSGFQPVEELGGRWTYLSLERIVKDISLKSSKYDFRSFFANFVIENPTPPRFLIYKKSGDKIFAKTYVPIINLDKMSQALNMVAKVDKGKQDSAVV